jgi:hypothetical protein
MNGAICPHCQTIVCAGGTCDCGRTKDGPCDDPEQIVLHNVTGFARRSGTDEHGCQWLEFDCDYGALEEAGECVICGKRIETGWVCLDGGDEACDSHVVISEEEDQ